MSLFRINPFSNPFLVVASVGGFVLLLVALYVPFFNTVLHTVPLGLMEWVVLLSYALFSVGVYEFGKKIFIVNKNLSTISSQSKVTQNMSENYVA